VDSEQLKQSMALNELKKRNTRRVFPDKKGNCLSKIWFASYYKRCGVAMVAQSLLPWTSSCWRLGLRHQHRGKAGENNHLIEFLISIPVISRISVKQRTERRLKQTEFLT
jgi:hypothetical protein